ncbi:neuropilin-2-like isoform X2 [Amphiura filiformis]|uniref:neuropilin-2-like isoform X2 n=1 Tax=Amphiura filiformis TaxID=82378 RepID=UPI003B228061
MRVNVKQIDEAMFVLLITVLYIFFLQDITDAECNTALGMESRDIPNERITASDFYAGDGGLPAREGRLNNNKYWATKNANPSDPWIQVDLQVNVTITEIRIQGSASSQDNEWVTKLQMQYGDVNSLTFIMEGNAQKTFDANTDRDTIVTITFPKPITASVLRIVPTEWHSWVAIRFEVIGCHYLYLKDGYQYDGGHDCLQNYDIVVLEARSLLRCSFECTRRENCLSFNLQTTNTGTNDCILKSAKREDVGSIDFIEVEDCRYYYQV